MQSFKQFLSEGGNVKIGDVAAAPFPISEKNRASVRADAHEALSALHDSFHKATGKHLHIVLTGVILRKELKAHIINNY